MIFPLRHSHSTRARVRVPSQQRSTSATYVFATWIFLLALLLCSGLAFVWQCHRERADREATIERQAYLARNVVDLINSERIGWDQFELEGDRAPSASDFFLTYDHPGAGASPRNSRRQGTRGTGFDGSFTSYTHYDVSPDTPSSVLGIRNSRIGRKLRASEAQLRDDFEESDLKFRQVSLDITGDMLKTYADTESPFRCLSTFEIHHRDPLLLLPTRPLSCECERPSSLLTGEFTYLDPQKCSAQEISNFMSVDQEIFDVDMSRKVNIVVTTSADHRVQLDVFLLQFEDMARDAESNFHVTIAEFEGNMNDNKSRNDVAGDELRDILRRDDDFDSSLSFERISLKGEFSRVLGLRRGVQSVRHRTRAAASDGEATDDPLVLVADTTMFFPGGFFNLVRMHTVAGRSAFSPICTKQFPDEGMRRNLWGYGIIAFHLSDYDNTETFGYNVQRANAWGQEDTDFISELRASGLKIERILVPNYEYVRVVKKDSASWYYLALNSRDRTLPVTPVYQEIGRGELEFDAVQKALEQNTRERIKIYVVYKVHDAAWRARGYYAVIWMERGENGEEFMRATYVHSLLLANTKTDGLVLEAIE